MLKILMKTAKTIFVVISALAAALIILLTHLQFSSEKPTFDTKAAARVSYSPLKQVVPGEGLPEKVQALKSNNNLDITRYKGRWFMAFRTAPTHFASRDATLYVVSSSDLKKWDYEVKFNMSNDLREPRFMVFRNKLFLYFFQGGANPLAFVPDYIYATEYFSPRMWKQPMPIYEQGFVVWRAKEHDGKAYMSVYYGVGLYTDFDETNAKSRLQLLESTDGYNWKPVGGRDVTTELSAEEGEFEFDDDGNLYATIRYEMKGGAVCRAPKEDLAAWKCRFTNYKYDSALMFRRGDDFYVVARRNVDGPFNKQSKLVPKRFRSLWYLLRYSGSRKRTCLYKIDKKKLELVPLFDFPSRGDTAYAGIAPAGPDRFMLFNYSSDVEGFDWSWIAGQLIGSRIYSTELKFGK